MQRRHPRFEVAPIDLPAHSPRRLDRALRETRTLVLVSLVMFGFQYRAGFEPGLKRLPEVFTDLKLGSMAMMLLALAFLALPAIYSRLVPRRDDEEMGTVTARSVAAALVPFAVSLGLDVTIAAVAIAGTVLGLFYGGIAALLAMLLWYGLRIGGSPGPALPHGGRFAGIAITPRSATPYELDRKLEDVLGEIRMMLPGAQALLGFQFSVTLMQGFEAVSGIARSVYLVSLGLIALATILLMTPAALHRRLERSPRPERFQGLVGGLLIASMGLLALALSGDVYVAASRVARFTNAAPAAAAMTGLFFYALWFGVPMRRRRRARKNAHDRTFERG